MAYNGIYDDEAAEAMDTGGIDLVAEPHRSVITLWGAIDVTLRTRASEALAGALVRDLPVVVDTSGVLFIDSSGVAFLAQLNALSLGEGLPVSFRETPPVVGNILELIGLELAIAA